MTAPTAKDVAAMLNARIADLARDLFGEPNRELSTPRQLRFGTHGSVAVEIAGDEAGRWFDHEHGAGGDGLAMVKHRRGHANGAALDWARQWLGLPPIPSRRRKAAAAPAADDNSTQMAEPVVAQAEPESAVPPPDDAPIAEGVPDTDAGAAPGTDTPPTRSSRKAPTDAERAAKVAAIVAGCEDPHGTRVETYLGRRGITEAPLPAAIRYLPNAYGHYGALVGLATDAQGQVHGLQLIYLTEDGRKAPLKVQKRTNKAHDRWSDVAAVRLPGSSPLVLCEGIETALSIWQATGQESWACLGISNIARAPVPEGAPVVIARDGDEPNSKADQQLRQAVTVLRSQGHDRGKGRLIDIGAANARIDEIAGAMRDALLNWPARVAGQIAAQLGAEPHLVQTVLQEHVAALLAETADRLDPPTAGM